MQREELPGPIEEIFRVFVRGAIESTSAIPSCCGCCWNRHRRSNELLDKVERLKRSLVTYMRELLDAPPRGPGRRHRDGGPAASSRRSSWSIHQLVADHEPVDHRRLENELVAMLTRYVKG